MLDEAVVSCSVELLVLSSVLCGTNWLVSLTDEDEELNFSLELNS